jgi:hypothetical protein
MERPVRALIVCLERISLADVRLNWIAISDERWWTSILGGESVLLISLFGTARYSTAVQRVLKGIHTNPHKFSSHLLFYSTAKVPELSPYN